jgi:hypothetical protein
VPFGGVDDDTCRLVDDDNRVIDVQHGERHTRVGDRTRRRRRFRRDDHDRSLAQSLTRLPHDDAADGHPPGLDPTLQRRAREVRTRQSEVAIEPLPDRRVRDSQYCGISMSVSRHSRREIAAAGRTGEAGALLAAAHE